MDGGSLRTSVLVIDPLGRPVVGTGDGLAALEVIDGGMLARWPADPPSSPLAITAAVVEQGGTLVLALGSDVIRLRSEDLGELTRVGLRCPAHELVARRDGSLLAMVRCPDTDAEPGTALWALDAALQPTWKARPPLYTSAPGQVLVDEKGTIYTNMGGVLSVLIGQQPPAESSWPMSAADAQRSGRSPGFDAG